MRVISPPDPPQKRRGRKPAVLADRALTNAEKQQRKRDKIKPNRRPWKRKSELPAAD